MSDEAQTRDTGGPTPPSASQADPRTAPKVGLGKREREQEPPAVRDPWAPPVADATPTPAASAEDVPLAPSGDATPFTTPGDTPTLSVPTGEGPGATLVPGTLVPGDPLSWPPPSVHDQVTVVDATPAAQPWAGPGPATPAGPAADPFAAPGAGAPRNPFAPPGAATPPNPFAAPGAATPPNPFAAPTGAVPPPPIAPDGPGRMPYAGYAAPGAPAQGYGYPGGPQTGYYGWPGQAMPENGMGTAGLVLGVLSAIVFCLWPLAIVLGVLGVIFGAVGRGKAKRGVSTNAGQALAGIICGAVGIVLGVGMGLLIILT
ncbi:hypothetical protein ACIPSE_09660 [Streptomyces sp. NPDC090106]|uniref:hypothetical protein n=1 Tax=Streptomyces sp. NPDC090106 TaxID=3365946 RepID=UPI0037F5250B